MSKVDVLKMFEQYKKEGLSNRAALDKIMAELKDFMKGEVDAQVEERAKEVQANIHQMMTCSKK